MAATPALAQSSTAHHAATIATMETVNVGHDARSAAATDAQLVTAFVARYQNPHTAAKYRRDLDAFTAFVYAAGLSLRSVGALDVEDFAGSLTGAPKSRRERLATVKSFYSWCVKSGALRFNPAATLRLPDAATALHERIIAPADVDKMIAATSCPRDRALLLLLFRSGARVSELCGLTWSCVDVHDNGSATIRIVTAKRKAGATIQETRCQTHAVDLVSLLLSIRREGCDYVFTSHNSCAALDPSNAWRVVKAAAAAAGLDLPSPHWLRHACASLLVSKGYPLPEVAAYLGHKSIQTTMKYVHLSEVLNMSAAFATT